MATFPENTEEIHDLSHYRSVVVDMSRRKGGFSALLLNLSVL